jgi:predicted dehydrogenase
MKAVDPWKPVVNRSNRRGFLRQSAGAATIAGLAAKGAWADSGAARRKVRIGVVGGGFGTQFQWHEHPDCIVQAVSDLRPERRQALVDTFRCNTTYDSLEQLVLAKDIDAVAIFTDGPLHVDHVIKAMKNGKHAISAVPAAWGTIDEAEQLLDVVKSTGLTYMLAETSYYQQPTISARKFYQDGAFGEIYYCNAAYQHAGVESLGFENGKRTWRYGVAPMHYPTHTTSMLIAVTGERLTEVVCHGWGDDSQMLKDNPYGNPFSNASAMFKTNRGHPFDCQIWWRGAHRGAERAEWIGTEMSFYGPSANGLGAMIVRRDNQTENDDAGFQRDAPKLEPYAQPQWWATDMLPQPLRHDTGHDGSHTFLTHEFVDALVNERRPAIDVYEALAYTVPGIVAHQSALRGGELMKIPQFDPPGRSANAASAGS